MTGEFTDKELGRFLVRVNARAKNLVFRTRTDAIYVTVPPRTTTKDITNAIEKLRNQLTASKQKQPPLLIDLNFKIDTEHFKLSLTSGCHERFTARSESGTMEIMCPENTDFTNENLQAWLRKVIEESLRKRAKTLLPSRLYSLADRHKLPYAGVKINSSRGRWGSCSTTKNINLSYFLVMLPGHLIDYVLLHELCHTREMNHSDQFWTLLDSFTGGKAVEMREELKNHRTEFF